MALLWRLNRERGKEDVFDVHTPFELKLVLAFLNFETVFPQIDGVMFGQRLAPHELG